MTSFAALLPVPAAVAEGSLDERAWADSVTEGERSAISGASASRRQEFLAGRGCAHTALNRLTGGAHADIAIGERREPRWPSGVIGSITHAEGQVAAVVTRPGTARSLGIDMEGVRPLDEATAAFVLDLGEREQAARAAGAAGEIVGFSAKESVFKAWFPLTGQWLEPAGVRVTLHGGGTFDVALPGEPARWAGSWRIDEGIVRTAVVCLAA